MDPNRYVLTPWGAFLAPVLLVMAGAASVVMLLTPGEITLPNVGLVVALGWCAWWSLARAPQRIETDDLGLTFVSRTRRRVVPWASLLSVTSCPLDFRLSERQYISWRWDGGRQVTWGPWQHQRSLLDEVVARAPACDVFV